MDKIDFSDPIQALEFTARHWRWLAENPEAYKTNFPELIELERMAVFIKHECGLCEELRHRSGGQYYCQIGSCLLYDFWASNYVRVDPYLAAIKTPDCINSIYGVWNRTPRTEEGLVERSRLALMISEAAQEKANELKKEKK